MDIYHRLALNNKGKDKDLFDYIERSNIKHKKMPLLGDNIFLVILDIMESSPHWEKISSIIKKNPVSDICETYFCVDEILSCKWVRLCAVYEKDFHIIKGFDWRSLNFQNLCPKCGSFTGQVSPYEFVRKGKLSKHFHILGGTDDIITSPKHIEELKNESFSGFEAWPIILKKEKTILSDIQQLFVKTTSSSEGLLESEKLRYTVCPVCNRKKFFPHNHGWMDMKQEVLEGMPDIFLSYELFGSGGAAFKETIISNRLASFLIMNKWTGFRLKGIKIN